MKYIFPKVKNKSFFINILAANLGKTALHIACFQINAEVVKVLLKHGINFDTDDDGMRDSIAIITIYISNNLLFISFRNEI
jgi:ankyrin repeat protein